MEMKRFGLLWKCLLLAALDVGTVLLFFSVWDVVRLNIFPVVLLHLLLVLLMVDAAVIALPYARRRVPGTSWLSFAILTAFYYVVVVSFTALTCTWMTPWKYAVWSTVLFLAYGASALGMILTKRRRHRSPAAAPDQADPAVVQRDMQDMEQMIRGIQGLLEPRQFESLCRAYASLREHLAFSTPFGRCPKPVVLDMEKRISDKIENCLDKMRAISPQNAAETVTRITLSLMDTSELVKNKERLLTG